MLFKQIILNNSINYKRVKYINKRFIAIILNKKPTVANIKIQMKQKQLKQKYC